MKFVKYKYIQIFAFMIATVSLVGLVSSTKVKSETKGKRSESMMELLNSFFTDSSDQSNSMYQSQSESESRLNEMKWKSNQNKDVKTVSTSSSSSNITINGQTTSSVSANKNTNSTAPQVLQDWFAVSSPSFENRDKFPSIKFPDGTIKEVLVDSAYFRINPIFDVAKGADKGPNNKFFWFRLSGLHLYYSATKSDINILGAISINSISNIAQSQSEATEGVSSIYCLSIDDSEKQKWKICNTNQKSVTQWMCQIKNTLGQSDIQCSGAEPAAKQPEVKVVEKQITQPIVLIPLPSRQCNEGWDYQQNGMDWECDCSEGKEQSPIDLPPPTAAIASAVRPLFQYDEVSAKSIKSDISGAKSKTKSLTIKLQDNMLKILHDKFGKLVTMDGAVYYAQEIQIHTPGEHTINGKKFDMEIQIIHNGVSKGDISKQAILAFPIENTPGVYNKFIDDLDFFNLPNPLNTEVEILSNLFIPKIFYSADDEDVSVMKPFSFYTYQGSLTSPPMP